MFRRKTLSEFPEKNLIAGWANPDTVKTVESDCLAQMIEYCPENLTRDSQHNHRNIPMRSFFLLFFGDNTHMDRKSVIRWKKKKKTTLLECLGECVASHVSKIRGKNEKLS